MSCEFESVSNWKIFLNFNRVKTGEGEDIIDSTFFAEFGGINTGL